MSEQETHWKITQLRLTPADAAVGLMMLCDVCAKLLAGVRLHTHESTTHELHMSPVHHDRTRSNSPFLAKR